MDSKIFGKILDILTDNAAISNEDQRRAYYSQIFTGEQIKPDVDLAGAPREGNRRFINVLRHHTLNSGENALFALLRLVHDEVGIDVAKTIDDLIAEITHSTNLNENKVPQAIFIGFGPDDAELGHQITDELSEMYEDIDMVLKEEMEWTGDEPIYCAVLVLSGSSKALAQKEAKKLIKGGKRIIRVLAPGCDESSSPMNLLGTPAVYLNDSDNGIETLKRIIQDTVDIVRGLERDSWELLINKIQVGECVPIIGPDMCRDPIMSESTLAVEWSQTHGYGLRGENEIARVAQYLGYIRPNGFNVKSELTARRLLNTRPDFLDDEHNHYRMLSRLPFPIFITTNSDGFLFEALKAEGKSPKEWHLWNEKWIEGHHDEIETGFINLTDQEPAIVYLFGHYSQPELMRVSEDEFLEYIFNIGRNASIFPTWLPRILRNNMLLILGFQLHDWTFRTITRVFSEYLVDRDTGLSHLAVQVAPLKDNPAPDQVAKAEHYLRKYLQKMHSDVFLGEPVNFLNQLAQKWEARPS